MCIPDNPILLILVILLIVNAVFVIAYKINNYDKILGLIDNDSTLKEKGFSGKDYEFYLTTDKDDESKYYIGAFYNKEELAVGRKKVEDWHLFCKQNKLPVDTPQTLS